MVEYEQVEAGIFVYRWAGRVDMVDAMLSFEALRMAHTNAPYVAIIDMRALKQLPSDIRTMRGLIRAEVANGLLGYVVVGAPRSYEAFIRPLAALAPTTYQFVGEWESAVEMARELLGTARI